MRRKSTHASSENRDIGSVSAPQDSAQSPLCPLAEPHLHKGITIRSLGRLGGWWWCLQMKRPSRQDTRAAPLLRQSYSPILLSLSPFPSFRKGTAAQAMDGLMESLCESHPVRPSARTTYAGSAHRPSSSAAAVVSTPIDEKEREGAAAAS